MPWKRLQSHRPPAALVRRWFQGEGNLGLLCGPISEGLVVLDFDRPLPYYQWRNENPSLAATYTVQTARGYHAYLRVQDFPHFTLSMEGGDVKGSGYVVAPPSVHPTGWQYRAVEAAAPLLSVEGMEDLGVRVMEVVGGEIRLPVDEDRDRERGYSLIDDIRAMLPIASYLGRLTTLSMSSSDGTWLMARCPLHDDRRPSMWVNSRKGVCRCFKPGCRGHERVMDVINLHGKVYGRDNRWAMMDLAAEMGL